mgnify:CR=1 FL=1
MPTFAYIISGLVGRAIGGREFGSRYGFGNQGTSPLNFLMRSAYAGRESMVFRSVQGTLENTNKHVMAMAPLHTQTDSGALAKPNSANDHQIKTSPK